jgi:hypothetical protein
MLNLFRRLPEKWKEKAEEKSQHEMLCEEKVNLKIEMWPGHYSAENVEENTEGCQYS